MSEQLSKTYDPQAVESGLYDMWEQKGLFRPQPGKKQETFSITMPPPNVTGKLHMGHALDTVAQDALIRYKRMKGFETIWVPGMDHAGIATQSVVEKQVAKEEKKRRQDFSREQFLEKIWAWKNEYGGAILSQLKALGASCDWDNFLFTMDDHANKAVKHCFVKLYNSGLIYQSDYIVNWDPKLQSAISDAEVEHKEIKGAFYHIKYPVKDSDQMLEIATTRPETMLGDTAVAVNPEDERFKHLVGKTAIIPLCNREVPIIADTYVDLEVGTGCLKVTPGHDFNDFEIGRRHKLPIIKILSKDGRLNEECGKYHGLTVDKGRKAVLEDLKGLELLVKVEKHTHQVGHGDRSKAIIEPMVSKQWFLNVNEMASEATEAVRDDRMRFYPKGWENTLFSWLDNPRDWCISRQLWWGHQIPVYYCDQCQHQWAAEDRPENCPKCQSDQLTQDPDVLDTWFSSGLWPMTTLGWPDPQMMKEKGFERFFPTSVLVTGFDIIFFWVARMMMMSLKMEKQVPFDKIYIHAIVNDKHGKKMSKSSNNGIDPMEIIEQYGADAMRFTLAAGSGYNRNLNLDPQRIGGYRNFINKIWNAFRFIHPFLEQADSTLPKLSELDHHERWILTEFNQTAKVVNHAMDEFRFDDACSAIYAFVYNKFCSWFIELSKGVLHEGSPAETQRRATVLKFTFRKVIALLHPMTPFITENLWSHLKSDDERELIIQDFPEFDANLDFPEDGQQMNHMVEVITAIRNLRASVDIKPKEEITVQLFSDSAKMSEYLKAQQINFYQLAKVDQLIVSDKSVSRPKKSLMAATDQVEIFIPLEGVIDLDQQIARMKKELAKVEGELGRHQKKLANKNFADNAPNEVIA
ncbi:MAG: valine--tRNA ligase, partial [Bdellovibrionales bacterium]|nr:valine--tRNA ligase [Bdellovibrionales bacterium]